MSGHENNAVFLSYASQDAEAARRIADALRAAGVEVWFDQSELVGGDAWDAKIRRQIKECALLIPVISANTQARTEGYFRLEWRLADQRTHLMAKGRAFLLPVVIDDTRDGDAHVPDSFTEVQWTRLPGGAASEAITQRVKKLLGGAGVEPARPSLGLETSRGVTAPRMKSRPWLVPAVAALVAVVAITVWQLAKNAAPTIEPPGEPKSAGTLTEARKLADQARALIDDDLLAGRENFRLAQELAQKATVLDPTDGEAWATLARVLVETWSRNYDSTLHLREQARSAVERANRLAPTSVESGLAASAYQIMGGQNAEAERIARATLGRAPNDQRCLRLLAGVCFSMNKESEALELLHRSGALTGGDVKALTDEAAYYRRQMRLVEAEALVDRAMARAPSFSGYQLKLLLLMQQDDLDRAQPTVEQIPARLQQEDVFASLMAHYWLNRGEPDRALEILQRVPRDFFEEQRQYLPKGWVTGWAMQMAGRPAAAKLEWQEALAVVERRLKTEPNRRDLILYQSRLLALLGRRAEADAAVQLAVELNGNDKVGAAISTANVCVCAGDREGAIKFLLEAMSDPAELFGHGIWSNLKHHPMYAPIRSDPRIQQLIAWGDERMRQLKAGGAGKPAPGIAGPVIDGKSVAVLAFANLSDDKANEYFSDGISEELLNVLAKVPGLKVSARTSAFYFKGKEVPVPEIAKQLGVAYVVEGSVRKQGDKVRITAQLIKAADGFHVWSDTFTRDLKDIFAVQDEIAGLIAKNLELKMGMGAARPTVDLEAYQEYLTGRALFAKASNEDLRAAIGHFEKALAIEPKFTAAWVQLASVHTQLGRWGGTPTLQAWAAARAAIDQAMALEPDSPDVLLALGWILRTAEWNWRGAERAYRRALELRPNHPDTLSAAAVLLYNLGQKDEALSLGRRAVQLDPLNAATQIDLSLVFYFSQEWAEHEKLARRAIQLAPAGVSYHGLLAYGLAGQRRFAEAEAEARLDTDDVGRFYSLGIIAALQGQVEAARGYRRQLEELSRARGDTADLQLGIADISALLGDKDQAFAALEKAVSARDPSIAWFRNDFFLGLLNSDPRWKALLRKVGLADDQLK